VWVWVWVLVLVLEAGGASECQCSTAVKGSPWTPFAFTAPQKIKKNKIKKKVHQHYVSACLRTCAEHATHALQGDVCGRMRTYADVCGRMRTYAHLEVHELRAHAPVVDDERLACYPHTSAYVRIRPHTSEHVSIRQHTSAYVSIRQHTSSMMSDSPVTSPALSVPI
jgi:hypothetical protein